MATTVVGRPVSGNTYAVMFRISPAYASLTDMELSNLDFNLLRTLDAVLQESSVTRAAERLEVSHPAVSLALAKLQRHFDDEGLVYDGRQPVRADPDGRAAA